MTNKKSLLALFAHPDDEAFTCGGSLAQFAATGVDVTLVCATRGEVGEISDPALATSDTLGLVRDGELRCACEKLGINAPIFLGYRDSGMVDTPDNKDPRAFMNIPADSVMPTLVGLIRRLKPQILITFDPNGGYGHPDHIAIHTHAMNAFHIAADPNQYPDQGTPWQVDRLYYVVLPQSFFTDVGNQLEAAGLDTSEFDRFRESGAGWPDEGVDLVRNVSELAAIKWEALNCHQTQLNPNSPFNKIPEDAMQKIASYEHFVVGASATTDVPKENDFFSWLSMD